MSETHGKPSEIILTDLQMFEANQICSMKIDGKDKKTRKIIENVRNLDASIRELEIQLEAVRAESSVVRMKNSEELKKILASESPESGTLAKNTRRFLELCDVEENTENSDKSFSNCNKSVRSSDLQESTFVTAEDEKEIGSSTNRLDDSAGLNQIDPSDSIVDHETECNPYSIDKSSKKLLKRLEFKLKRNARG